MTYESNNNNNNNNNNNSEQIYDTPFPNIGHVCENYPCFIGHRENKNNGTLRLIT